MHSTPKCNKATTKLELCFDAVAVDVYAQNDSNNQVGTEVCSAFIFQGFATDINFLGKPPFTSNSIRIPALFLSISKGDSWIYYKENSEENSKDGKVVAKLRIPAGLSVIVTTEIHSGLVAFNPQGLVHFSQSVEDRVLLRIVHRAPPGGLHMDRDSSEWTQFLGDALSTVWYK